LAAGGTTKNTSSRTCLSWNASLRLLTIPDFENAARLIFNTGETKSAASFHIKICVTLNSSNRPYGSLEDLKQAAIDAWRAVCLISSMIQPICADTVLRAN
jgi:hypothetical protein